MTPKIKTKQDSSCGDKSLDRITISICEADISRQTFYRHFKKVRYPFVAYHVRRQFYLNEISRTINWEIGYYSTCYHART
ncbi:MAG: hypothetical protein ACLTQI_06330 [Slackia sp.]